MASHVVKRAKDAIQPDGRTAIYEYRTMSEEPTATAEPAEENTSHPDQDWGKIAFCVVLAIIAALGVHFVVFSVVFTGVDLSPTVHALLGMVLFFFAGFVSFSVFY